MADVEVWARLRTLAADQFGLFTAAQARQRGVHRYLLARRTHSGELFRARYGVYGFADRDAEAFPFEDWAAQWLALRPSADIADRRGMPDSVISRESAAVIRELGTVVSYGLHLTSPERINTRSPRVHAHRGELGAKGSEWEIVAGLPVATAGRIIADLARDNIDGSHQGTVIADAINSGQATLTEASRRLEPFANRWHEPNGESLAHRFISDAGRALPAAPLHRRATARNHAHLSAVTSIVKTLDDRFQAGGEVQQR
jgi:hypothetical protein